MAIPKNKVRTGGPRTSKGLANVSANALRTGSYPKHVLLPGENLIDFQQLTHELQAVFQSRTTRGSVLVNDIVILVWKKIRLEKASHSLISSRLSLPPADADLTAVFNDPNMPDGVSTFLERALWTSPASVDKFQLPVRR